MQLLYGIYQMPMLNDQTSISSDLTYLAILPTTYI